MEYFLSWGQRAGPGLCPEGRCRFSAQAAAAFVLSFPGNGAAPPGTECSNLEQFMSSSRFRPFWATPLVSHVY